ncbi:MAG TPA: AMP-binding protein, partial [Acidimicrobiales bacterium]
MHLPSHIRAVTELDPSSGAVQYRATWHTWGELAAIRDTLDTVLTERGIVPGMPVGVVARNRPHVIAAILGLFCTNRAVVVVNSMLPAAAVEDDVYNLRLPALIADPSDWARGDLIETARSVSTVGIRVPDQCDAKPTFVDGLEHGTTEDRFVVRVGTAACMLTSGTTGPPKRVAISYRNFEQALDAHAHYGNGFGSARLSNAVNILSVPPVNITGMWQLITSVVLGRR